MVDEIFIITDVAAQKIDEFALKTNNRPLLRVALEGGGCSGFLYNFSFEESALGDDVVFTKGAVSVVVDPLSLMYLMGSTLDYTESLSGSGFVLHNTNFKASCGCGKSFGI